MLSQIPAISRPLHLLLPATSPDPNFCKLLLTLATLGYPSPVILGWGITYTAPDQLAGGSHLGKITETSQYLEALGPEHDDDVVMLLDAYDIWFQLPPSVLLERWEHMTSSADLQLAQKLGLSLEEIKASNANRIVFAAGKRCAPNEMQSSRVTPFLCHKRARIYTVRTQIL